MKIRFIVTLFIFVLTSCKTPVMPTVNQELISETNPAGESTVRTTPVVEAAPSPLPAK